MDLQRAGQELRRVHESIDSMNRLGKNRLLDKDTGSQNSKIIAKHTRCLFKGMHYTLDFW